MFKQIQTDSNSCFFEAKAPREWDVKLTLSLWPFWGSKFSANPTPILLSYLAILDPRSALPYSSDGNSSFELIFQDSSTYVYPFSNGLPGSFPNSSTTLSSLILFPTLSRNSEKIASQYCAKPKAINDPQVHHGLDRNHPQMVVVECCFMFSR